MNKSHTPPNYIKVLNILFYIISLAVMTAFIASGTPRSDEHIGIYGVAFWGAVLAALIAVALAVVAVLQSKR